MSGYTIQNLKELEDSAVGYGLSPSLEARFARKALEGKNAGMSYQKLAPGFRVPFGHKHGEQEEIYVVLDGSVRVKLDDEIVELKAWDAVRVEPGTMRGFEAGADGAELLAFGAGASGDGEIVQGWWSD